MKLLLLIPLLFTSFTQECEWPNLMAQVVYDGREQLRSKPNTPPVQFRKLMTSKLNSAKAEHDKVCLSDLHYPPIVFSESQEIQDQEIRQALVEAFFNPKSFFWVAVLG